MKGKWVMLCILSLVFCTCPFGCTEAGDDADDDDDNGDTGGDEPIVDYTCIPEEEPDPAECGDYPEAQGWDMDSVVTNLTFDAFYDRDCDGKPELTKMDLYRDVYCQRDKIKSIVIVAGSSCGETGGVD